MSAREGRSTLGAVALATVGGLVTVGATAAGWVTRAQVREVGGVELAEVFVRSGTEFAPQLYAVGLMAVVLGLTLLVVRGGGRRIVGSVVALLGALGLAVSGSGTATAASADGSLTPGPAIAALGAAGVLTAGVLAARPHVTRPSLPARYSIDQEVESRGAVADAASAADPGEDAVARDEWDLASVEPGRNGTDAAEPDKT